jgi:hypothetical protein
MLTAGGWVADAVETGLALGGGGARAAVPTYFLGTGTGAAQLLDHQNGAINRLWRSSWQKILLAPEQRASAWEHRREDGAIRVLAEKPKALLH